MIRTENVSLRIGGLEILRDVTVELREGEVTSIIGPNGAGKTTLFNVITGRIFPTSGSVWFRGKNITKLPPFQIARIGIARSFQINNIFQDMTVLDNISIAAQTTSQFRSSVFSRVSEDAATLRKAEAILDLTGLAKIGNKPARELSHGDRRHLEIGMSLATEPHFLMLDEPTSGMSPAETEATNDLIRSIGEKVTICLIEHKMNLVMKLSKRIIVLNFGQVIADGSPEQVASDEKVRKTYLGTR